MQIKTRDVPQWLLITAWIIASLCLVTVLVLLFWVKSQTPEPVAQTEPSSEVTIPPTMPLMVEAEPTLPILNLVENPYGPEDFDFRGRYLICTAGSSRMGVDVSEWQEDINWLLVKAAGMEVAMVRLAFRGSTEGIIKEDATARANLEGALEAGMAVGGYLFSQAVSVEEAIEEAEFVLDMVKDYDLQMPIVFDWERSENRTAHVDARTVTDCALAFCQTIEDAGYETMVYFNRHQAYYEMYLEELKDYGFWYARYESEMDFPYKLDAWQYSQTGSVPGIPTKVDLNIWFDYE